MFNVILTGVEETKKALDSVRKELNKQNAKRVQAATYVLLGAVKLEASGGTIGGSLARGPAGATGDLARSWTSTFTATETEFEGRAGSNKIYAKIHEEGSHGGGAYTIITAKRSKYLTIPLTPAAARGTARDFDLEFVPLLGGGGFVLIDAFTGEPQYLLKRSVKIPARRYASIAMDKTRPRIAHLLDTGLDIAIEKVET